MGFRVAFASAVLCVCASMTLLAADRWVRLDTPNFVVFSQVSSGRTSEIAGEFERFRESLARVIPSTGRPTPVPTIIVVFKNAKSFAPYRPRTDGKPREVGGFFAARRDHNLIALGTDTPDSTKVMFHEYTHMLATMAMRRIPPWLNEGLAEFYSTFELQDRGKRALLGKVVVPDVVLLREHTLPIEQLLTGDPRATQYAGNRDKTTLFYAEAWGLVHMLLTEQPIRASALSDYALRVEAGADAVAAWRAVFGPEDPIPALHNHVNRQVFSAYDVRFPDAVRTDDAAGVSMSQADVDATLGHVLTIVAPASEALPPLERAASAEPVSWLARALLARARVENGDAAGARPMLVEAAQKSDDWLVKYFSAAGLTQIVSGGPPELRDDTISAARNAVDMVLAVKPELPEALADRALLYANARTVPDEALAAIRRARQLAPGRPEYALTEGRLLLQRGDVAGVKSIAISLQQPEVPDWIRSVAQALLMEAKRLEARRSMPAPAAPAPASQSLVGTTERPIYRELADGEQRTEGTLLRIECPVGRVLFHLRVGDDTLKFTAPRLDKVDFITYRPDSPAEVRCGARPAPEHVFITWRPAPGARGVRDRIVVSVELLPDL